MANAKVVAVAAGLAVAGLCAIFFVAGYFGAPLGNEARRKVLLAFALIK